MNKAIAVVSGGMDSATLAYLVKSEGFDLHILSFDYGQRHKKELDSASWIADELGVDHTIIDITAIKPLLKGSALTDDSVSVPHGHYAEDSMKSTVVPNRNAIMLSIAWGMATAENAKILATAVHGGDHFVYPDCRPDFIHALNISFQLGTRGHSNPELQLYTPFSHMDKGQIASLGKSLNVPYHRTWTCYEGGNIHCGACGACVERQEAMEFASVTNDVAYKSKVD